MELTSPAFENGGTIPQKYGLDFENTNPPLSITGVPGGARSFVLFIYYLSNFMATIPRTFWKDAFGWGFLLWFFGYAMGMLLFTLVPPGVIGWIIMPIGTLVTLWVLIKKVRGGSFCLYVAIAAVWLFIAAACDYLFLVLLFKLAVGYYKPSVYIYYALMALLPVFVGWYKVRYVSRDTNT